MAGSNTYTINYPASGSAGSAVAAGGSYIYTTNNTTITQPWIATTGAGSQPSLQVTGDAHFDGTVTVKGRDLVKLFEKIEDRLAIVSNPDPKKLEKFKALKKAYDHYKLMEKLIGEEE
jgi:Cu/Zn superoxide dismutase